MEFKYCGTDPIFKRRLYSGFAPSLADAHIPPLGPNNHFVFLLALDASSEPDQGLQHFASAMLEAGAIYACAWGVEAQRVEAAFDAARDVRNPSATDATIVLTTSHANESLDEAVWFATVSAHPAQAYEASCKALVAMAIGQRRWHDAISAALVDPQALAVRVGAV